MMELTGEEARAGWRWCSPEEIFYLIEIFQVSLSEAQILINDKEARMGGNNIIFLVFDDSCWQNTLIKGENVIYHFI